MLASAFVSYIGAFDAAFRQRLCYEMWLPDLTEKGVLTTEGVDPLDQITNDAANAKMMSEGLPSDRISIENGSMVRACSRWPLIIDPQLQAIKWLRRKCEPKVDEETGEPIGRPLVVLQLSAKRWLNALEHAISTGAQVIIENLGEKIDATLDPILARAFYKKGRSLFLQLGGEKVEYDTKFQLYMYLQTKLANQQHVHGVVPGHHHHDRAAQQVEGEQPRGLAPPVAGAGGAGGAGGQQPLHGGRAHGLGARIQTQKKDEQNDEIGGCPRDGSARPPSSIRYICHALIVHA
jgi:hypothetical protein